MDPVKMIMSRNIGMGSMFLKPWRTQTGFALFAVVYAIAAYAGRQKVGPPLDHFIRRLAWFPVKTFPDFHFYVYFENEESPEIHVRSYLWHTEHPFSLV